MSPDGDQRGGLWPDLAPWRSSRGFRLLFASRTVTALGTQASEVAVLAARHARDGRCRPPALRGITGGLRYAVRRQGAFGVTVLSGWMGRIRRYGLAIALSAAA